LPFLIRYENRILPQYKVDMLIAAYFIHTLQMEKHLHNNMSNIPDEYEAESAGSDGLLLAMLGNFVLES
jgi:hypothetical protein